MKLLSSKENDLHAYIGIRLGLEMTDPKLLMISMTGTDEHVA